MGDPRRQKNKYSKPPHPWEAGRIESERKLVKQYGLKNKKEIWKAVSLMKKYKRQAKKTIASQSSQGKVEEKQLLNSLARYRILAESAKVEDVLDLSVEAFLDRRLQSVVVRKGLARTPTQARQFIIHGHIGINQAKVDRPSYLVHFEEEGAIQFLKKSPFVDEEHAERTAGRVKKKEVVVENKSVEKVEEKEEKNEG